MLNLFFLNGLGFIDMKKPFVLGKFSAIWSTNKSNWFTTSLIDDPFPISLSPAYRIIISGFSFTIKRLK